LHISGRQYLWIDEDVPIAKCPDWLATAMRYVPRSRPGSSGSVPGQVPLEAFTWSPAGLYQLMGSAAEGNRNNRLYWCAHRIRDDLDAGIVSESSALVVLADLAELAERSGLTRHAVEATIESGSGYWL
jgi:hypothetical protein